MNKPIELKRTWSRMSEAAMCRLHSAHRMIAGDEAFTPTLAMTRGTVLEPRIIEYLTSNGMQIVNTGQDQVELMVMVTPDLMAPLRDHLANVSGNNDKAPIPLEREFLWSGHPDGRAKQCATPSAWMTAYLPAQALEALRRGDILIEIKTMNDRLWKIFKRVGLDEDLALVKYRYQGQAYLGAAWDSGDLLEGELVIALNSAAPTWEQGLAFQWLPADRDTYYETMEYTAEAQSYLQRGELPAPDLSGEDDECRFCDVKALCPAAMAARQRRLEAIAKKGAGKVVRFEDDRVLNALANAYLDITDQCKALEAVKSGLRAQIEETLGQPMAAETSDFFLRLSEVKGRETLDQAAAKGLLEGAIDPLRASNVIITRLSVAQAAEIIDALKAEAFGIPVPYKQGNAYTRLTVKPLSGPESGDD